MGADPLVPIVERAYQQADGPAEWLEGLADAAVGVVPEALAVAVRLVRLDPPMSLGTAVRAPAAIVEALRDHEAVARERRGDIVLRGNPGLRYLGRDAAESDEPIIREMQARFLPIGVVEMCHVTARGEDGHCVTVGFLISREEVEGISQARWGRLEVHLAASLRIFVRRRELLRGLLPNGAVLAPGGRVVDADGIAKERRAREQLREAVRRVDAARRSTRADALEIWRGLVDGTWSIVDRHDRDGTRYIVAVPNAVTHRIPEALSQREAQVAALAAEGYADKWIAYTLGLSRSTVSTHLHAALQKLGVRSRVSLAKAFRLRVGELTTSRDDAPSS